MGTREEDFPRHHVAEMIDRWRWPLTVVLCLCLLIAAACYLTGHPISGLVHQLSAVFAGSAVSAVCVVALRVLAGIRQWSGIERNTGENGAELRELRRAVVRLSRGLESVGIQLPDDTAEFDAVVLQQSRSRH
ncbi:hypothetical protein GUJ16_12385 [Enterococcus hirae]|nr:hypothetical protein [Enterococcus hirae]